MALLSYRRHRFPPEIIQHAIWLYLPFTLSYRDVEERHCQLSRPWFARCVGGAAAWVGRSFARLMCCPL
jgi:putative transposase